MCVYRRAKQEPLVFMLKNGAPKPTSISRASCVYALSEVMSSDTDACCVHMLAVAHKRGLCIHRCVQNSGSFISKL